MIGGFRQAYSDGVDEFYSGIAEYFNPHTSDIRECLVSLINMKTMGPEIYMYPVLDFCAGGGEVTTSIKSIDQNVAVIASDPYTQAIYRERFNDNHIYDWSFDDVINECIPHGLVFSVIICSYALHLCPKEKLKLLCLALSKHSKYLCVLSPHKKPVLTVDMGWAHIYDTGKPK